jgi:hypothetical protein
MKEKLYEIPIDHPLTPDKRKVIDQHIASNAHLAPSKVSHEWHEAAHPVLRLNTPPASWEVTFTNTHVEVYASAPFWARLLFTSEKRLQLKGQLEVLLRDTGFVAHKSKDTKKTPAAKRAK